MIYLIIGYFAWQKPRARYVSDRWGTDYPRRGWSIPLIIALGVLAVLFALVFVVTFIIATSAGLVG
ncbi:MAG: hypothetical protein ACPGU7_01240 [Gammaproteobacteria bacterium]